jgi:hypothetical protein
MSEARTCGECKWWIRDGIDPGWPNDGMCHCPIPAPVVRLEENIGGWDFYIDQDNPQAESCACFEKKED